MSWARVMCSVALAASCRSESPSPKQAGGSGSAAAGSAAATDDGQWARAPLPVSTVATPLRGTIEVPPMTELSLVEVPYDEEESDVLVHPAVFVEALGFSLRLDDYTVFAANPVRFAEPTESDAPPQPLLTKRAGQSWFVAGRYADGGVEALGYHPESKVRCTVLRAPRELHHLEAIARVCLSFQPEKGAP